jgi:hypothetical protein
MSEKLQLTIRDGGKGKLAIINGKTYSLLRLYRHERLGGIFCLVVAGRIPLRVEDLDEQWYIIHGGTIYIALDSRPFSYHLIQGEGSTTYAPRWPRLKAPAAYCAFVGPIEEAVQTQIHLTLGRYYSRMDPDSATERVFHIPDACGGAPAYLLKADWL